MATGQGQGPETASGTGLGAGLGAGKHRERAAYAWTEDSVRLIASPSDTARASLLYVQEVGRFRTMAGYFTERERLESFLVVYTVAGRGRLVYRGRHYELAAGQAFLIDCMEYHYYATDPQEPWELLWVHLNGAGAARYYEMFDRAGDPVLTLPSDAETPALVRDLIRLQQERTVRSELAANRLLVGLLTELLLAAPELGLPVADAPEFVRTAIAAIERDYRERLTLDRLAAAASVNKYHLAKEFKRFTGFSPNEYLINVRMSQAKELLKYSDLPVARVAEEVGIDNASHFIRLFKDRADATPLAFRHRWRPRHRRS